MNLYDAKGNVLFEFKVHNLTVMCFNAQFWSGLNADRNLIRRIVDTYSPDIIMLQECRNFAADIFTAVFGDYPYHYLASEIYNPVSILSKHEMSDISTVLFTTQAEDGEVRGYARAYITANRQKICLMNTHLEVMGANQSNVRHAQALELLEAMKAERYAICAGDFNVADCHNNKSAEYIANIKPFIDEGYHSANCSDQHGFLPTFYSGTTVDDYTRRECIDEIITTSNIDINMVTVDKQKSDANTEGLGLDHLPIVAYCRVNG